MPTPDEPVGNADRPTTLDEALRSIEAVEQFGVRVRNRDGRRVRGNTTRGVLHYPYKAALNGNWTVDDWKSNRCRKAYPLFDTADYTVEVLDGNGDPCVGQKKLRTVRESYR